MTNEQAILLLEAYKSNLTSSCSNQLDGDIEAFDMAIKSLRNERPHGDWIINPDTRTMKCSRCGAIENADRWLVEDMNYCHCCGADMQKGGAEE